MTSLFLKEEKICYKKNLRRRKTEFSERGLCHLFIIFRKILELFYGQPLWCNNRVNDLS